MVREAKSATKLLQQQLDRAVALADREVGITEALSTSFGPNIEMPGASRAPLDAQPLNPKLQPPTLAPMTTSGGLPTAPTRAIPPTPAPEAISLQNYAARVEAGWVPVLGLPGTPITAGFLRELGEYNPKMEGLNAIWTYQEMRRGCSQVASVLDGCKLPILSAEWQVKPVPDNELKKGQTAAKAKEVADFIRENLLSGLEWQTHTGIWITQNWKDAVRYALRMLDFGASCVEEIMTVDGDKIRLRRLADRQALTFYRWHTDPHSVDPTLPPFVYDDGETLYALEQWGYRSNRFEYVLLPMDKACLFTREQEGANFWGIPLTRAMYPHWYIRGHCERIKAIACERTGVGIPVILLPPNPSKQDVATAQAWVTALAAHEKCGLTLPNGAEFKLIGVEGRTEEILTFIEYEDTQIAKRGFMEFQQLGQRSSGSGSRAVGGVQAKFFYLASQFTADDIAAKIRNTTVRRLTMFNFGPDAPVPYLVPANVQARAIEEAASVIQQLASGGAWISDLKSVNKGRNILGFDPVSSKELSDDDVILGPRITIPGNPAMQPAQAPGAGESGVGAGGSAGQKAKGKGQMANGSAELTPDTRHLAPVLLARQPAAPLVAPRAHPSPFFREGDPEHLRHVYPHEAYVDFPAHWKALRGAEAKVAAALRVERPRTIRAMANTLAKALAKGTRPKDVSFSVDPSLAGKLAAVLDPLYGMGQTEVRAEHQRLWTAYRKSKLASGLMAADVGPSGARPMAELGSALQLAASTTRPKGGLFAEIAAQFFEQELTDDATKAGISIAQQYGDALQDQDAGALADELFGGIGENSDGFIDVISDSAARGSFRAGRGDAFDEIAAELARQGYTLQMIRVCAMEKASCDSCRDANGQPLEPGEDITAIHEGPPETCECEAMESI